MARRVIIIHGWEGSPQSNWFPWLKTELEGKGFAVDVPAMPDAAHPDMRAWLKRLSGIVGRPDAGCYLVGHSLGCITILRYLEGLEEGAIGGAVLVAGFSGDLGIPEISNFFTGPVDWSRVRPRCGRFVAINSDDDPYVPLSYGKILEEKLGARLVVRHKGHFSDGMSELPEALEALLDMANE